MPSPTVNYPSYEDFLRILFSIIEEQLNTDANDPLPDYRKENSEQLQKILHFVQDDRYYPDLTAKAAYLFTSITTNHIYSNGNKRLALVSMLYFLFVNDVDIKVATGELRNIAIYVADSMENKQASFDELKEYVKKFIEEKTKK